MISNQITKDVRAERIIKASAKDIFKVISDHENTHLWINEVEKVSLLKEGANKNGLGALRQVKFTPKLWSVIDEDILEFTPDERYTYTIVKGMPGLINHLGSWTLSEAADGGTKVVWAVHFEFKKFHWFGLLVNNFASTFNKIQISALESLEAYLKEQA
jgi:uncharacterized protein YndB with AHSA1/START domain